MRSRPSILSSILQSLPLPGLIHKGGELFEARDLLIGLGDTTTLGAAIAEGEDRPAAGWSTWACETGQVRIRRGLKTISSRLIQGGGR